AAAISSLAPNRPIGCSDNNQFRASPALPTIRSTMSVAIVPGATELTRMPCLANSSANALLGELERDCLGQAFHGMLGRHVKARLRQPIWPATLEVFTMAPP